MGVGFSGGGGGVIAGAAATASGFFGAGAGAAATAGAGGEAAGLGGVEASGFVPSPFDLMCALKSATCCDSSRIVCLISASSLSRASSSSESWSEVTEALVEPDSAEVASPNDDLGGLAAEGRWVGEKSEEIEARDASEHDPEEGEDPLRYVLTLAPASSQHWGRSLPFSKFRPKNDLNMANLPLAHPDSRR
jgi:hypothetical protein